jgi:hypothetical protein
MRHHELLIPVFVEAELTEREQQLLEQHQAGYTII